MLSKYNLKYYERVVVPKILKPRQIVLAHFAFRRKGGHMRWTLLIVFIVFVFAGLNVSGASAPPSEEELVYQAIAGSTIERRDARKLLQEKHRWQEADDMALLFFLDNCKPGLNVAIFFSDKKYLHATQAEIINDLLKAIKSYKIESPFNYPYSHYLNDGGIKKDAMIILKKMRALAAFKKILFMPLGVDVDSWIQREFVVDCIIELEDTTAVTYLDSVQRNEKYPLNTRVAASAGIIRIAKKDKSNKAAWKGVEYAKTNCPNPVVQTQAKSLIEGTEDPYHKAFKNFVNKHFRKKDSSQTSDKEIVVSVRKFLVVKLFNCLLPQFISNNFNIMMQAIGFDGRRPSIRRNTLS